MTPSVTRATASRAPARFISNVRPKSLRSRGALRDRSVEPRDGVPQLRRDGLRVLRRPGFVQMETIAEILRTERHGAVRCDDGNAEPVGDPLDERRGSTAHQWRWHEDEARAVLPNELVQG